MLAAACCWLLLAAACCCLLLPAACCCRQLAAAGCRLMLAGCCLLLAATCCLLLLAAACCCLLLAPGCWLLAAASCRWLLAAGCLLLPAACWLLAAFCCCLLLPGCCLLLAAACCWLLVAGRCCSSLDGRLQRAQCACFSALCFLQRIKCISPSHWCSCGLCYEASEIQGALAGPAFPQQGVHIRVPSQSPRQIAARNDILPELIIRPLLCRRRPCRIGASAVELQNHCRTTFPPGEG